MKTLLKLAVPVAATLAIALAPREAHALGPIGIEVGAVAGAGTNPTNAAGTNPLGFGIGARAGVSIFSLYGGLRFMDYLGGGDGVGGTYHAIQFGGELGYSIKLLDLITIRPQIGLGNITFSDSNFTIPSGANSFFLEPGALAMISLGIIYVGADVGALIITGGPASSLSASTSTDTCFTAHGQVGLTF
jgi:hypothetical protein